MMRSLVWASSTATSMQEKGGPTVGAMEDERPLLMGHNAGAKHVASHNAHLKPSRTSVMVRCSSNHS